MTTIELTEAGDVKREIISAPHVGIHDNGVLYAKFPYFTPDKGAHIVHLQMDKDEALQPSKPQEKEKFFLGICDISFSARGGDLVIISHSKEAAEKKLLSAFNKERRAYGSETFKTFAELNDWNGASVKEIKLEKAHIWQGL